VKAMPKIDLNRIGGHAARQYAEKIVARGGRLRATKPRGDGRVVYVWRNVAFAISPKPAHQCMPVTDFSDLWRQLEAEGEGRVQYEVVAAEAERLQSIIDEIIDSVPKSEWHGILRWGRALGAF